MHCPNYNYYYFCKSNISAINLIEGSNIMIKDSKNFAHSFDQSLIKIRYSAKVFFTKLPNFLVLISFKHGTIFENALDK